MKINFNPMDFDYSHVSWGRWYQQLLFNRQRQIQFLEDFLELLRAHLPAQAICQDIANNGVPCYQPVARDMLMAIGRGHPPFEGLVGWMPMPIITCLRAGQQSGDVERGVEIAITMLTDGSGIIGELLKALLYPLTIQIVLMMIYGGPAYQFFAKQQESQPLSQWSGLARWAWEISEFCHHYNVILGVGILGIVAGVTWALPNVAEREKFEHWPICNQYRTLQAVVVLSVVAALMRSGLGIRPSLSALRVNATPWLDARLVSSILKIDHGKGNYGEIFDTGLVYKEEIHRLTLLSRSADKTEVLIRCSERLRRRLMKQIVAAAKFSNVISMALAGALLAILAAGGYIVMTLGARGVM